MIQPMDAVHFRMHIDGRLNGDMPLPDDMQFAPFDPSRHARAGRELLNVSFRDGGGEALAFDEWWDMLIEDDEYDPELCFVIEMIESGKVIAFAQCWVTGFIKDIAVHPEYRRRGIGRCLMERIFHEFERRKIPKVDLRARRDNPNGALQFYKRLGMVIVL